MRARFFVVVLAVAVGGVLLAAQARSTLDIYVVDVEGGNATLFVAPSGQSVLIDTGNGGAAAARDAGRILDAAKDARLTADRSPHHHALARRSLRRDGGARKADPDPRVLRPRSDGPVAAGRRRVSQGCVSGAVRQRRSTRSSSRATASHCPDSTGGSWRPAGQVLQSPLPGAGQPNPYCAGFKPQDADPSENAQSVGSHITFGRFRAVHLGDLTWNKEAELMCPDNRLGTTDLLVVGHHGQPVSNSEVMVHALRPRVSIINNGTRKGGQPEAMRIILNSPGLEDVWQMHFSLLGGQEYTVPGMFIANTIDEQPDAMPIGAWVAPPQGQQAPPAPVHNGKAFWFKVTAQQDGTFSVTNTRNNLTKTYAAGATSAR